ncbi:hypothetical protein [Methylobacterium radiotolerans]|uniref:Uncharacterized protein n=1 Tax=Methylobacterium radiotolerans (strain ATCC 27329 / DSM 1819 / JCM 2831 / NBRC 15690 / NCIMB 10815 / 0-1) TaxID=426355 RepID=B1MAC6_METRJ|nr:hypothetical protein [Methylobacterium radiotolerans]ACB28451.1 hypothetical protein Mrad2831_6539 [Methylobacterium radiotolerans JCM 2831]GEN01716.1 hypothetical protein MRA01_62550 [Methylobacterium radiotolerans]
MPWTVVHGIVATKEQQANPPAHMLQTSEPFDSKQAAMNHAIMRLHLGATNVVVKDGSGEVVADFNDVWRAAFPPKPAGN